MTGPRNAPPSFDDAALGRIVFAKFHAAHHAIEFDVAAAAARVESTIDFEVHERGCPVIDLEVADGNLLSVEVGGNAVPYPECLSPPSPKTGESMARYRVLGIPLEPGRHRAAIRYRLVGSVLVRGRVERGLHFSGDGVECFFGMSDLGDPRQRHFLERYLPSNLEFDRHPMDIEVAIQGARTPHRLVSNGEIRRVAGRWHVQFPPHFTCSSPFLLIAPQVRLSERSARRVGVAGATRWLHVVALDVAGAPDDEMARHFQQAVDALALAEDVLGAFPHPTLTLYFAPFSGMEYAGAALVNDDDPPLDLVHEVIHSWLGRGVMAADGDAGWFDEGLTSLIEFELFEESTDDRPMVEPSFGSDFGRVCPYRRFTDGRVVRMGQVWHWMQYMRSVLPGDRARWSAFARQLVKRRMFESLTTMDVRDELERHVGRSLTTEFDPYVLGP